MRPPLPPSAIGPLPLSGSRGTTDQFLHQIMAPSPSLRGHHRGLFRPHPWCRAVSFRSRHFYGRHATQQGSSIAAPTEEMAESSHPHGPLPVPSAGHQSTCRGRSCISGSTHHNQSLTNPCTRSSHTTVVLVGRACAIRKEIALAGANCRYPSGRVDDSRRA